MGEIISIREQIRPYEFRIGYTNGEERVVSVDPDKRVLFGYQQQEEKKFLACPFLRQRAPRERICTVYASRPELCRNYLCSRILVLDQDGKKPGGYRTGPVVSPWKKGNCSAFGAMPYGMFRFLTMNNGKNTWMPFFPSWIPGYPVSGVTE